MPAKGLQHPYTAWSIVFWAGLTGICYLLLGHFTPREDFFRLLLLFALVFGSYFFLLRSSLTPNQGIGLGVLFRLLFLLALPALSDDFFRFVWDGRLLLLGESPFAHLPTAYITNPSLALPSLTPTLYQNLNSPNYYSVYPPVCQAVFGLAVWLSPESIFGSVVLMRAVLIMAEVGTMILATRLLPLLGLPPRRVLLYALNPLVIVELTGNLHFEALMIFFLLGALYLLLRQMTWLSAVSFALAVGVKLLPLMLLPLLFGRLTLKGFLIYCLVVGLVLVLLFFPFLTGEIIGNLLNSVNLYFQKFEFNASFYFLARWLGYQVSGYNQIAFIGRLFSLLVLAGVLALAYRYRQAPLNRLPHLWLSALTLYLLLSTTVHPWYLTTLVALAMFTSWRYPMVWSGMAVLSYAAYRTAAYQEHLWLVAVEYAVVLGWMGYEGKKTGKSAGGKDIQVAS